MSARFLTKSPPRGFAADFLGRFALMMESGHAPARVLGLLADNPSAVPESRLLGELRDRVLQGVPLAEVLEAHPNLFPAHVCAMIRAGESSGRLAEVAADAAALLDRAEQRRRETASLLIYPAILFALALAILALVVFMVLPQFEAVFADISGEARLPRLTEAFLGAGRFLRAHPWAPVPVGLLGAILLSVIRRAPGSRRRLLRLALRLPVFGRWLNWTALHSMARLLASVLRGGVDLLEGLRMAREACPVGVFTEAWRRVDERLRAGEPPGSVLASLPFCRGPTGPLIALSEGHGDLARALDHVALLAERELSLMRRRAAALIEPLIVLALAGFVGLVVASLFLPMAGLIRAFSAG